MILADRDIKQAVVTGEILIDGFDEKRLQPASYDILLGHKFVISMPEEVGAIDPIKKIFPKTRELEISDDGEFILHPGQMVLGTSWDFFGSAKYLIQLSGKSSLARLGLLVHNTAGIVNPGHFLNITLELYNLNSMPIILRPKMPIAQLIFSRMTSDPQTDYAKKGHYSKDNWKHFQGLKKSK